MMCNIWPEALAIQKGLDSICIGIDNKKLCEIAGEASKYRIEIQQQLAAANARIAESEAQNKRMQTAINRYVIGNIDLLDALKAALEEKP